MRTATATPQDASIEAAIASALRWWRDAGVDVLAAEEPRQWLARIETKAAGRSAGGTREAAAAPAAKQPQRHHTLAALTEWLMTAPDVPEAGAPRRRVGPEGDPASGLMILADFPDPADIDAGRLFAGEIAPMFERMLAAVGRSRETAYLATIAPGRPAKGRIDDALLAELGPIARRHVELVAPRQLWLMGTAASRAILGLSDREAHGRLHSINLNGGMVEAVVTAHPRFLTDKEKKARAWAEMQRLIAKDNA